MVRICTVAAAEATSFCSISRVSTANLRFYSRANNNSRHVHHSPGRVRRFRCGSFIGPHESRGASRLRTFWCKLCRPRCSRVAVYHLNRDTAKSQPNINDPTLTRCGLRNHSMPRRLTKLQNSRTYHHHKAADETTAPRGVSTTVADVSVMSGIFVYYYSASMVTTGSTTNKLQKLPTPALCALPGRAI